MKASTLDGIGHFRYGFNAKIAQKAKYLYIKGAYINVLQALLKVTAGEGSSIVNMTTISAGIITSSKI